MPSRTWDDVQTSIQVVVAQILSFRMAGSSQKLLPSYRWRRQQRHPQTLLAVASTVGDARDLDPS